MDMHEALERRKAYPYAYIRSLSRVAMGKTPETLDTDELIEARFFDGNSELRIFRDDNGLRACVVEPAGRVTAEKKYRIGNPKFGKSLTVMKIIDTDEDGQAFVADLILCGWEGA